MFSPSSTLLGVSRCRTQTANENNGCSSPAVMKIYTDEDYKLNSIIIANDGPLPNQPNGKVVESGARCNRHPDYEAFEAEYPTLASILLDQSAGNGTTDKTNILPEQYEGNVPKVILVVPLNYRPGIEGRFTWNSG